VDCDGYLIVEEHGKMADLKCNSCGAVVETVPLKRAGQRLMQLALVEISSVRAATTAGVADVEGWMRRTYL